MSSPRHGYRSDPCELTPEAVPKLSLDFSADVSGPPAIETQKGNLIKDSQCQSQNAPVPKSSAYDTRNDSKRRLEFGRFA
jgi:hypothetical protein